MIRGVYAVLALPFYAAAKLAQVGVVAYRAVRSERRLQREARIATEQRRRDLAAEEAYRRGRRDEEREWGAN